VREKERGRIEQLIVNPVERWGWARQAASLLMIGFFRAVHDSHFMRGIFRVATSTAALSSGVLS